MTSPPLKQATSIDNVFNSAYWHLGQQNFTIDEMRNKLARKTDNTEWIDTVIERLIDSHLLKSDVEFAIIFCESAFSNQIGKNSVQQKLKRRGIKAHDIETAVEQVVEQQQVDFYDMASNWLQSRFNIFEGVSKEKVFSQMTSRGFSRPQINHALSQHPAQASLLSALVIKAAKVDLSTEIMKLYRKGKGQSLILNELKQRLIDVSEFEETVYQLALAGDIDFYQSCKDQLAKKKYNLAEYKEKSKAFT